MTPVKRRRSDSASFPSDDAASEYPDPSLSYRATQAGRIEVEVDELESNDSAQGNRAKRPKPSIDGYPCKICRMVWRTESDYKKDQNRHKRPHKCTINGCPRKDGFSTVNDLNRHLKSRHSVPVPGSKDYKCLVSGCSKPDKIWPRLDNFRQHAVRMHPDFHFDQILSLSQRWFEQRSGNAHIPSYVSSIVKGRKTHRHTPNNSSTDTTSSALRKNDQSSSAASPSTTFSSPQSQRASAKPQSIGHGHVRIAQRRSLSSAPGGISNANRTTHPYYDIRAVVTDGQRPPPFQPVSDPDFSLDETYWLSVRDDATMIPPSEHGNQFMFIDPHLQPDGHNRGYAHQGSQLHVPHINVQPPSRIATPSHPPQPMSEQPLYQNVTSGPRYGNEVPAAGTVFQHISQGWSRQIAPQHQGPQGVAPTRESPDVLNMQDWAMESTEGNYQPPDMGSVGVEYGMIPQGVKDSRYGSTDSGFESHQTHW